MEYPGRRLRKARERLRLKYRDVEEASQEIARHHDNQEFAVGLSRLADIENKGTVPSLYRLYSLCAIYGLDFEMVLAWYGVRIDELAADAGKLFVRETRTLDFQCSESATSELPERIEPDPDLKRTFYLSPAIKRWGRFSLAALGSLDLKRNRYAFIGTEDWFMYPIIPPGSFVQIDEEKKEIPSEGWQQDYDRPIHFVEHREGYRYGWCTQKQGVLIMQPHAGSRMSPEVFPLAEIDVVGQIVGVAMRLDSGRRLHRRF